MKNSVFVLAAAIAAFVLGCQNPEVNNPVAAGDNVLRGTVAKSAPVPNPNVVGFDQAVRYTDGAVGVMQAIGNVAFRITSVPNLDADLYDVEVTVQGVLYPVSTAGTISSNQPHPWMFGKSSIVRIRIPQDTKAIFELTFRVEGANVPTVLNMPIAVTDRALAVRAMSLTKTLAVEAKSLTN